MKTRIFVAWVGLCLAGLCGGAGASAAIEEPLQSGGTATLRVSGSVKTHTKRYHALESTTRGTDAYAMEVVVAGKTYRVPGAIRTDTVNAQDRRNPEEGSGVRYDFAGEFDVPAGLQNITVRLPEEGISMSRSVNLTPGKHTLVVEPSYRKLPRNRILGFRGTRHFSQHVEALNLAVQ